MTRLVLARKAFRDARVTAFGGGLLSFSLALMYVCIFPSVKETLDQMELPDYMQNLAGAAGSYGTPAGYLSGEFFTLVPIILIIFAIVSGTGATAGEESAGTLELLLAQPVRRRRLLIEKALGIGAAVTVAMLAAIPGVFIGQAIVDFDLSPVRTIAAMAMTIPLILLFLAISMFTGALFPTRSLAVAVSTALAVAAYVLYTLGLLVEALGEARKYTPFYWADASKALVGDYELWRPAVLLLASLVILGFTIIAFERRDIGGGREFSWRRLVGKSRPLTNSAEPTVQVNSSRADFRR
ncbi:MAG: ABC transporter permease subunit [Dehalococcoidia bacterium]